MSRFYIPVLLFIVLILEGVALELLPNKLLTYQSTMIPHWILIFLILIAMFFDKDNTYFSIVYAIIFGLLIDIVYTEILGIYMFAYGLVTYIVLEIKNFVYENLIATILVGGVGVALADLLIYITYTVIDIVSMPWPSYLLYRLLPTILANIIFLLIMYLLFKKRLEKWQHDLSSGFRTF